MKRVSFLLITTVLALPALRADTVEITMTGVNGAVKDNVYVGAYYGQITNGPAVNLYCDDYVNDSHIGQKWTATVSTFSDLSATLHPGALGQYRQVAWLTDQFGNNPNTSWGDIHYALWSVFNPSSLTPLSTVAQNWLTQSLQAVGDSSLDNKYVIYTPVIAGQSQEFLSPAPTPEPGSILLLATALAGAFLLRRKTVNP